ncbi:unnamed protein product [Rhizophagus irregularis]|nr:unnamed protein product [Rhizophagus irregularis]
MDIHVPYGSNAIESENVTMYTWLEAVLDPIRRCPLTNLHATNATTNVDIWLIKQVNLTIRKRSFLYRIFFYKSV